MNNRIEAFEREHPRLYAARHVAKPIGSLLLVLIGIGIAFALPLPSIDLPSIPFPDLPDLPDLPDWLGDILKWGKYVVLILIGVLVALSEVEKRRERDEPAAEN